VRSVLYVYILQNQENNAVPNSVNEVPYSVKIKCPESPPHNPYVSVRNIQGVIIISELLNSLMECNNRTNIVRIAEIKIPIAYTKLNENYVKVIYLDNIENRKNFLRVKNYSINESELNTLKLQEEQNIIDILTFDELFKKISEAKSFISLVVQKL
jgi:hypothetical protein